MSEQLCFDLEAPVSVAVRAHELSDVPLGLRLDAVRTVVAAGAEMSVTERLGLLAAALWPAEPGGDGLTPWRQDSTS